MSFLARVFIASIVLTLFFLIPPKATWAEEIFKPELTWGRSTEAQEKILFEKSPGARVEETLNLPIDPNQIVFDNGLYWGSQNLNLPPFASWKSFSAFCFVDFQTRHFQAKFNLPGSTPPSNYTSSIIFSTPSLNKDVFFIDDNIYVYLNRNFLTKGGSSYSSAPNWSEVNGNLDTFPVPFLKPGENIIDIVTEEHCSHGQLRQFELKLILSAPLPPTSKFPLSVPYFNQTDLPWGDDIYNHADSLNLFCEIFGGPYMSACGCATTSAAMLLKFYKVDKSPTGEPTTPGTLNSWLKTRGGYSYGSVVWPFIQTYSQEAKPKNELQTDILRWVGFGPSKEKSGQTILNSYLNRGIPVILEGPNHFVISKGISGSTYLINDPRWPNRTTLEFYANTFSGMRLFEPTHTDLSTIYITTPLPTDILLIDSQGRRVGKDPTTGIIYEEIPNSSYFLEPALVDDSIENAPLPPASTGVTTLSVVNPEQGNFNIQTSGFEGNYSITFYGFDINGEPSMQELQLSVTPGATQEFQLHYSQEPGFQIQVIQTVDIDIKPGSDPNAINLKSNGIIPVAILTTPSFDATQVNVATVEFGPNKAKEIHDKGHLEDANGDGDIDLILHFRTQETGIQNTNTQACLTGTTLSGIPIQGCDSVKIVGK